MFGHLKSFFDFFHRFIAFAEGTSVIMFIITKVILVGIRAEHGDDFHLLCAFYILKSFLQLLLLKTTYIKELLSPF